MEYLSYGLDKLLTKYQLHRIWFGTNPLRIGGFAWVCVFPALFLHTPDRPTLHAGQSDVNRRTVRRLLWQWLGFAHPSVAVVRRDAGPSDDYRPDHPTISDGPSDELHQTVRRPLPGSFALPSVFSCGRFRGSFCVAVPSRVLSLVATS